jgi:hypothetical protein
MMASPVVPPEPARPLRWLPRDPVDPEWSRASRPGRSYAPIGREDLVRLARIARLDREDFFARKTRYRALDERLICVALCQGAALHYVDGKSGVKDFDVWTFYAALSDHSGYPWRRRKAVDFGDPKFGPSPDKPDFTGRHVDLLGRSLRTAGEVDPATILRRYLFEGETETARRLSEKAVVLLEPLEWLGEVIRPLRYDG